MSYTPTEWKSGDVITSEKLNNLEQGVADASGGGGAALVNVGVTYSDEQYTLQKTLQELLDYFDAGKLPYIIYDPSVGEMPNAFILCVITIIGTDYSGSGTIAGYYITVGDLTFYCTSLSDYPVSM